ncbi:MAG: amidohydrolase family protein [Gemmatimonadaceae bacterium]|nr:amidohydrolase family protein [Gemmatimonadaceae bacterium]
MRVDAHQHYWRYDAVRDGWITPAMGALRRDFLPTDAVPLLADARIDAVVAVQAAQSDAETEFLLTLAERHDIIRGVVGWVDLQAPDLAEQLDRYRSAPMLKGFRHIAQGEPDDFLARSQVITGVTVMGALGYSYDILIYPRQLAAAEQLVSSCPDVRFVLDHCAKPDIAGGRLEEWRSGLPRLARYNHVTCKLSGLVTEASWHTWTDADLLPVLDAAAEAFGPERLMFGSDWPVCLVAAGYARVVDVIERWAERLTTAERARVFGETAREVYRLTAVPCERACVSSADAANLTDRQ